MDTQTDTPTEESQVDASQLNAPAATEAETVATDSLTLAEINELTGMNYKDKDSALKSIKDMKSQAGKAADLEGKLKAAASGSYGNPENDAIQSLQAQLAELQTETFYAKNPDVNRELVETIAKANGISREEAMSTDLYKNSVAQPEKRTVAESNNRVAQPSDDKFDPKGKSQEELARFVHENFIVK